MHGCVWGGTMKSKAIHRFHFNTLYISMDFTTPLYRFFFFHFENLHRLHFKYIYGGPSADPKQVNLVMHII